MKVLSLQEVTRENWRATLGLTVFPEQQKFISDYVPIAAIALAKAYIRPGGLIWIPYAFYNNGEMVGFTELAYEPESLDNYWICHFFIDCHHQGRGYGKEAISLLLQFIRDHHHSVWRFNSPSIQKMITHGTSIPMRDFDQQEQF